MSETSPSKEKPSKEALKPPSFLQVMMSVFAAALGVQKNENYEREFTTGSPLPFIVGGILFTVLFVLTIIGVVFLVLP